MKKSHTLGILIKKFFSFTLIASMVLSCLSAFSHQVGAMKPDKIEYNDFKVICYDHSARIEIPKIENVKNYKIYISKRDELADLADSTCLLDSDTYKSHLYVVNAYNDLIIEKDTSYYFYLVVDGKTLKSVKATTQEEPKYWTDQGNYSTNWYDKSPNDNNFTINNEKDLAGLAVLSNGLNGLTDVSFANKTIKLNKDIDMSEYLWTPISTEINNRSNLFWGSFNGNNKKIKGLHTNDNKKNYQGLFGKSLGNIKNVTIIESSIHGLDYVGSIAGANMGKIKNSCER